MPCLRGYGGCDKWKRGAEMESVEEVSKKKMHAWKEESE